MRDIKLNKAIRFICVMLVFMQLFTLAGCSIGFDSDAEQKQRSTIDHAYAYYN